MVEAALVAVRWLHLTAAALLFGLALFPAYTGLAAPGRRLSAALAVGALVTAVLEFAAVTANMSGDFASAVDWPTLKLVAQTTDFGRLWVLRAVLAVVLTALAFSRNGLGRMGVFLAGLLLASLALTGHAQVQSGTFGLVHIAADGLHLLAAGLWLGALAGFVILIGRGDQDALTALHRFSTLGVAAVVTLIATGVVNTSLILQSPSALVTTAYGRVLDVKIALFAAMAGLALFNRWRLMPRLAAGDEARLARRIRRVVAVEYALGVLVLLAVALLGTMDPTGG